MINGLSLWVLQQLRQTLGEKVCAFVEVRQPYLVQSGDDEAEKNENKYKCNRDIENGTEHR